MNYPEEQTTELKSIAKEVLLCEEGGKVYFVLKGLKLPNGCTPTEIDALLSPTERDGYPSRLFFAEKISANKSLNWNGNNVRILERNWFAYSWKLNSPVLRLAQMVAAHLGPLQ
jgi:hypothetical protein